MNIFLSFINFKKAIKEAFSNVNEIRILYNNFKTQ